MDSAPAPNPFAFLSALSGERDLDRSVIGRTRAEELQICGHMALAAKVATLYAFSGNGKSSLINAGLIPFFNDLGYAVFKTRPRPPFALTDPTVAFKEGCIRENWIPPTTASDADVLGQARHELEANSDTKLPAVRRLLERLNAQQIRLSATPETRSADLGTYLRQRRDATMSVFLEDTQRFLGSVPMIVICDQFEEIFVHYYNTPALERFIEELRQACDNPALRVHFLFSMREDWVGSMIVFRDAIPDVFNCTYRLDPIRRSRATPALVLPLEQAGIQVDHTVADRILNDLAEFYRRQQRRDDVPVHLTPSRPDDPFIELPALQTIADRLWQTRTSDVPPFSLAHYTSLASRDDIKASGSPAAAVLDGYLHDTLRRVDDMEQHAGETLGELRLDVLYLLTDKLAHRKALGEQEILAELQMVRANVVDGAPVDRPTLVRALKPMQDCRLVRQDGGPPTDPRYELAHDFVVRSVVRAWKVLDRRRAQDAAVRAEQQKQNTSRLATLVSNEKVGAWIILALSAALMVTTLALAADVRSAFQSSQSTLFHQRFYVRDSAFLDRYLLLGFFGALTALLGVSAVFKVRTGVAISLIALCFWYTAFFTPLQWPLTSMALSHWATVFLCMIPALVAGRSNAVGLAERRRIGWIRSAVRAIDYSLFPISAVATFGLFSNGGRDEDGWLLWFLLSLVVVAGVQSSAIMRGKRTIGEWWMHEKPAAGRPRGRPIALLVASFIFAIVSWVYLVLGIQAYGGVPWAPYGAPTFFLLHAVVLVTLYWFVDRPGAAVELPDVRPLEPQDLVNVAADRARPA